MKKQKIFISISLVLALFMITLGSSSTAYAATPKKVPDKSQSFHVGSTIVTVTAGYDEVKKHAYAEVKADDYVDMTIKMVVYYNNNLEHETIIKGFDQREYGRVDYQCSGVISMMECYFTINSADGFKEEFPFPVGEP